MSRQGRGSCTRVLHEVVTAADLVCCASAQAYLHGHSSTVATPTTQSCRSVPRINHTHSLASLSL